MFVMLNGEKVREIREQKWLSRAELAGKAGIATSTLRNVEVNAGPVRLGTARGIGEALGVSPRSLGGGRSGQDTTAA